MNKIKRLFKNIIYLMNNDLKNEKYNLSFTGTKLQSVLKNTLDRNKKL